MIRRPPRSTLDRSSAASDVYKRQPYNIQAFVNDDKVITSVKLTTYKNPPGVQEIIEMYDDGAHNDSLAGDKIYGASITPQNYGDWISYNFIVEDNDSNIVTFAGSFIEVPFVYASDSYLFNINNLSLPLDNRGILAAVNVDGKEGLDFEESSVLFSGGFYLSGLNNGCLLYTSDAADERSSVDLGGRRYIKKKKKTKNG